MAKSDRRVYRQKSRYGSPAGIEADDNSEEGKLRVYISIVVGFLLLAVFGAAMWINFEDRINGIDAYRTKWIISQRDEYKNRCEKNLQNYRELIKWAEQRKLDPDPKLLIPTECLAPPVNEETSAGGNTNGAQHNNH